MNFHTQPQTSATGRAVRVRSTSAAVAALLALAAASASAQTDLSDDPLLNNKNVAGNVALALSVEFPTANSVAHLPPYNPADKYIGYFTETKCYAYVFSEDETQRHFAPVSTSPTHICGAGLWSGNFLNWATMQTIDSFRMVLTGGHRVRDTPAETWLEKAFHSGQDTSEDPLRPNLFPHRTLPGALVQGATGLAVGQNLRIRISGLGNKMRIGTDEAAVDNPATAAVAFNNTLQGNTVAELSVRVKVCDLASGDEGLRCERFPQAIKPTGLIQRFSKRMRLSAFGYLNDPSLQRDGGVLRARQKFVGPLEPVPGQVDRANPLAEWDAQTGVFIRNPSAADAAETAAATGVPIADSGVINYLNKFGTLGTATDISRTYKSADPVSELFYATLRYFRGPAGGGNVPEWFNVTGSPEVRAETLDGFPVVQTFDDPVQFSCQRNFVLGVGDINTHNDKNVPGNGPTNQEPPKPALVAADTFFDAFAATSKIGRMEGLGNNLGDAINVGFNNCCNSNSMAIAGLAFTAHTKDIRPDLTDKQTVATFWMDVLESKPIEGRAGVVGNFKANNQYLLAAKYGGFEVPNGFNPDTAPDTPLAEDLWHTPVTLTPGGPDVNLLPVDVTVGGAPQPRPDNYFIAARPDDVLVGLERAFVRISGQAAAFTTALAVKQPQVTEAGNARYSATFNFEDRTGDVIASRLQFGADGKPLPVFDNDGRPIPAATFWRFSEQLQFQANANARRIVTFNPQAGAGAPFQIASLGAAQRAALNTPLDVNGADDSAQFLQYLRGDKQFELGASDQGRYRPRSSLVADIVGSRVTVVGPPSAPFVDGTNPGYAEFKRRHAERTVMLYVGSNGGMLHAIDGTPAVPAAGQPARGGREVFAYVPNAVFSGPDNTPEVNGLQALGNPAFAANGQFFYVNATPEAFDIDFSRTAGATPSQTGDWRTVLIGGLGKGGKSYYAIDVTDPLNEVAGGQQPSEEVYAGRVLWEFSHPELGFTFGPPVVAKTARYGWVVIFASGYNNTSGRGLLFFVNPRTGALLETVDTGVGTAANPAGLAFPAAFMLDRTNGIIDAVYAGDLLGNVWRVDVTAPGATPAYQEGLVHFARLTDATGTPQSVTSRVVVEVDPFTNRRFALVGTGRLLGDSDLGSRAPQSFYSFLDGTATRFARPDELQGGLTFPFTRNNLIENTNTVLGIGDVIPQNRAGWVLNVSDGRAGPELRIIIDPAPFFGTVALGAIAPNNEPCEPAGRSKLFVLNFSNGKTQLVSNQPTGDGNAPALVASIDVPDDVITGLSNFALNKADGSVVHVVGVDRSDGKSTTETPLPAQGGPLRRLNWREVIRVR